MKVTLLVVLGIIICNASFAQNSPVKDVNKEDYLHKSRVQKIIGNSFLELGGALFLTGIIIDRLKQPELLAGFSYYAGGVASALISIPFFISASKNKRKALSLTLHTQKAIILRQNMALQFIQPAATLKITL